MSFAAAAQFAPAILGGMYWKGASRRGALGGYLGRLRALDLHAAAAVVRPFGLAAAQLRRDRAVRHRAAQALRAVRARWLRSDGARAVLEPARQRRRFRRRLAVRSAEHDRADSGDAVRRGVRARRLGSGGRAAARFGVGTGAAGPRRAFPRPRAHRRAVRRLRQPARHRPERRPRSPTASWSSSSSAGWRAPSAPPRRG